MSVEVLTPQVLESILVAVEARGTFLDQDMQNEAALQHFQACFLVLDKYEQEFGASERTRQIRALINLDCARCMYYALDRKSAIKYCYEAMKFDNPPIARAIFYCAQNLVDDIQYAKALPLLQELVAKYESQLFRWQYFDSYYMLVTCLENEKRHLEADALFHQLCSMKKSKVDDMHVSRSFTSDAVRGGKLFAKISNPLELKRFLLSIMFSDYDLEYTEGKELSTSLPRRLRVACLDMIKITHRSHSDFQNVVNVCTTLIELDKKNLFDNYVQRAVAYFNLSNYSKAMQDCATAVKHADSKTSFYHTCSQFTEKEIDFLRLTALSNLFTNEKVNANKSSALIQSYEIKFDKAKELANSIKGKKGPSQAVIDQYNVCLNVLDEFEQACGVNPKITECRSAVHADIAEVFIDLGKYEDALRYTNIAIQHEPPFYWVLFNHAMLLMSEGRFSEALPSAQRLIANHGIPDLGAKKYFDAYKLLFTCLKKEQRLGEADKIFEDLLQKKWSNDEWFEFHFCFRTDHKRLVRIIPKLPLHAINKTMKPDSINSPKFARLPYIVQVRTLHMNQLYCSHVKDYKSMIDICTKLIALEPWNGSPFTHYVHRAIAHFNLNQLPNAKKDCQAALENHHKDIRVEETLPVHLATTAEIKFLRSTVLIKLFSVREEKPERSCNYCFSKIGAAIKCCDDSYYCSVACSKSHYPTHKQVCKNVRAETTPPANVLHDEKYAKHRTQVNYLAECQDNTECASAISKCQELLSELENKYGVSHTTICERAELLVQLSICHAGELKFKDALPLTAEALKLNPSLWQAKFNHALFLVEVKQFSEALPLLEQLVTTQASELSLRKMDQAQHLRIQCLDAANRYEEAFEIFDSLLDKERSKDEIYALYMMFSSDKDRKIDISAHLSEKELLLQFMESMLYKPAKMEYVLLIPMMNSMFLQKNKAVYLFERNYAKFIQACTRLVEIDKGNRYVHYIHRAMAYHRIGDLTNGRLDCTMAVKNIDPGADIGMICKSFMACEQDLVFLRSTELGNIFPVNEIWQKSASQYCAACQKVQENQKQCSRCKIVFYCNAECQKKHWSEHKKECKEAQF